MSTKENVDLAPEKDKEEAAPEVAVKESLTPAVSPPDVEEKYKGKSVEEIIEMHKNAEALATRKAQELADLKKRQAEPTVDDIIKMFDAETTPPEDKEPQKEAEVVGIKREGLVTKLKIDVLEARSDDGMPDWKEVEGECIRIAQENPAILANTRTPWTRLAYKLVMADRLPAKVQEAEERGRKTVAEKEALKVEASVISGSGAKAPVVPERTFVDITRDYREGKISFAEYTKATFNDAEKGQKRGE